ncbi:MAG: tRNA glutamyl-Q(34) synthetase GluQRS [Comamonadaceae bacterium]|nr:tRNA glutamyl-Q(34) synthetase GluQRS [Comamonadaceae bacterium]
MTAPVAGLGSGYIGRFAPSPTGPLHAGSLVAALASWLDARAHGGQWLVRIEDVDNTRCLAGLDQVILQQLAACSLYSDLPPLYQSQRSAAYQQALDRLVQGGWAYPCGCSRQDIEQALRQAGHPRIRHGELVYPGSCRSGLQGRPARAWRFRTDIDIKNRPLALIERAPSATYSVAIHSADTRVIWTDRALGEQQQDVTQTVGDFVLKRADGCFAYQLAVVVDDACQGVTDIVRGQDLADNTPRQILLQRALGMPTPRYLHTPLLLGPNGEKLSKQNGAKALDSNEPIQALNQAARVLGLTAHAGTVPAALAAWVTEWVSLQGKATD